VEFDLIERIRERCASTRAGVALGIGDDAAVLGVPAGRQLAACTDTLVAGVHFPKAATPGDIGWKSLAVNLSDLAAMGAEPAWTLLSLTLPESDMQFVERFADGFAELARKHDVALVGGDTTQGPLSVTVTALGFVPTGSALTRGGARAGDAVFVTGTLGDAAGALQLLQDCGHVPRALLARLQRPRPRIAEGILLRGVASACIDVSDGLLADLGHVCRASGVAAELDADALPISSALAAKFDAETRRELALSGGDDYELCFTIPSAREAELLGAFARAGNKATRIGSIVAGSGVRVLDARGDDVTPMRAGWEHFST
jgi:thiamine-monophosphate kinase